MNRREFLATGVAGLTATNLAGGSANAGGTSPRQFFEWRQYHLRTGTNKNMVGEFLKSVGIAALNRIGVKPVGVFTPVYGPSNAKLYVLLVHDSLDSVVNGSARLLEDKEVREKGASFIDASISEPAYVRFESSLLAAFSHMPKLEVPALKERIFELRIYESHCAKAGKKKVEMFNEGGEIDLFRRLGMAPVFFGETLIGSNMPNLTYMLGFDDKEALDKAWKSFGTDPQWLKLKDDPQYKDTVSKVTNILLRPAGASQI